MKYCPACGTSNPPEAKFCGKCGAAMPIAAPPPPPPDMYKSSTGTGTGDGGVSQGMKIGILVLTIIIPLVGMIMGVSYMNSGNAEKKSVGKLWLITGIVALILWLAIRSEM